MFVFLTAVFRKQILVRNVGQLDVKSVQRRAVQKQSTTNIEGEKSIIWVKSSHIAPQIKMILLVLSSRVMIIMCKTELIFFVH